jgi:hypothetical protein
LFSVKRIERELDVGSERTQTTKDNSDFDSMMVRGLRVAHKVQNKNQNEFKELPEQYITNDRLKGVA